LRTGRIPGRRTQAIEGQRLTRFDQAVLPHLGAAYNLARWLTRNDHDADDVVQEAYLRAYQFFDSFHGGDGRAWLLRIVRNTCYTWLEKNRPREPTTAFDETRHSAGSAAGPDAPLVASEERTLLRQALAELPDEFREAIVLRELEGLSYREIAAVTGAPIGTVMSRLARARERLHESLARRLPEES
jgi:RNA polymerase sigma factor (sigma-70 family)